MSCVSDLMDGISGLKNILRKNSAKVIETIEYLATEMPLAKACKVMGILTNQYYRWKNKINCTASVLNLCFKTHPHQLNISEVNIIREAINNPEYNFYLVLVFIICF